MKKYIALFLTLVLAFSLCACNKVPADNTSQTHTTTPSHGQQSGEVTVQSLKALAMSCIDKPVEVLYDLIGQPNSSDYAPSCLGDGEDGNLYYDGFTVYTYREGDTETVSFVE